MVLKQPPHLLQQKCKPANNSEAALKAGIPRSPNCAHLLSILTAQSRGKIVLQKMHKMHFLTDQQRERRWEQEIILHDFPSREYPHPYFLDYITITNLWTSLWSSQFGNREEPMNPFTQWG